MEEEGWRRRGGGGGVEGRGWREVDPLEKKGREGEQRVGWLDRKRGKECSGRGEEGGQGKMGLDGGKERHVSNTLIG